MIYQSLALYRCVCVCMCVRCVFFIGIVCVCGCAHCPMSLCVFVCMHIVCVWCVFFIGIVCLCACALIVLWVCVCLCACAWSCECVCVSVFHYDFLEKVCLWMYYLYHWFLCNMQCLVSFNLVVKHFELLKVLYKFPIIIIIKWSSQQRL